MKKILIRSGALMLAAFFLIAGFAAVAPIQVRAADEYTVSGVWAFNDSIPELPSGQYSLSFTCPYSDVPERVFDSLVLSSTYNNMSFTCFTEDGGRGNYSVYSVKSGWTSSHGLGNLKIVDFGETPQVVSEKFYTWLNANATFQAPPPDPGPLVGVVTDLKEQNLLTQVLMPLITMIPIGLAFLVCYKGFLKGLALLRKVLLGA